MHQGTRQSEQEPTRIGTMRGSLALFRLHACARTGFPCTCLLLLVHAGFSCTCLLLLLAHGSALSRNLPHGDLDRKMDIWNSYIFRKRTSRSEPELTEEAGNHPAGRATRALRPRNLEKDVKTDRLQLLGWQDFAPGCGAASCNPF